MSHSPKLSLYTALLISLNIMLGSGIFINTVLLAKAAGSLGALTYALMGLLLLPLVISFSRLMRHHQGGTFYDFAATLHPLIGFISSWSYFTAKMAACALGIHIFVSLVQTMIPSTASLSTLVIDSVIIVMFAFLNMLHVRIGQSIQYSFIILKMIPISFAILVGIGLFQTATMSIHPPWTTLPATFAFVLYAFTGFEAICSLSRSIVNPEKNGPLAIMLSYSIGVTLVVLYQFFFFGALGSSLAFVGSYLEAFPLLVSKIMSGQGSHSLLVVLHAGIASSSLGAAYGIMYSNSWNLFALANQGHVYAQQKLLTLNRHHMPVFCIILESIIALGYIWFSQGNQIPLQQICAMGMTLTYTLSVIALVLDTQKRASQRIIPLLALGSCTLLLASLIKNMYIFGALPYLLFLGILASGIGMYFHTKIR